MTLALPLNYGGPPSNTAPCECDGGGSCGAPQAIFKGLHSAHRTAEWICPRVGTRAGFVRVWPYWLFPARKFHGQSRGARPDYLQMDCTALANTGLLNGFSDSCEWRMCVARG